MLKQLAFLKPTTLFTPLLFMKNSTIPGELISNGYFLTEFRNAKKSHSLKLLASASHSPLTSSID